MVWPVRLGIRHRKGYKKLNVAQERHSFVLYKHGVRSLCGLLHTSRIPPLFRLNDKRLLPHFCRCFRHRPTWIVETLKYILLLLLLTCGEPEIEEEKERELVAYVCYNPESVWHLSECNDECAKRDYNGDAYCLALFDSMCETSQNPFIGQACGLYYD